MEIRNELLGQIVKHFLTDLSKSIKPFEKAEDAAYFCDSMKDLAIALFNDNTLEFDEDKFLLEKLYSRFKGKLIPFTESNLLYYLHPDQYHQGALFQKLGLNDTEFMSPDELQEIFVHYIFILTEIQKKLYLNDTTVLSGAIENKLLEEANDQLKPKIAGFNRARQTLIFYYLLKGNNIKKDTHSVAAMARFVHATLGIPYSKIDNSEFYEKLKSAPLFKKESLLLKDLEYVKEQFQTMESPDLARMVEEDITTVRKSLKWK